MFFLVHVRDSVHIVPSSLHSPLTPTVVSLLAQKYMNKVIEGVGLIMFLHSILKCTEYVYHPLDGGIQLCVQFLLVSFRPFLGEVITGTLKGQDSSGLIVSTQLFDHIFIPACELPSPSSWDSSERCWYWDYSENKLYFDLGQKIRVKAMGTQYGQQEILQHNQIIQGNKQEHSRDNNATSITIHPSSSSSNSSSSSSSSSSDLLISFVSPMRVTATIAEAGLGLVEWWE